MTWDPKFGDIDVGLQQKQTEELGGDVFRSISDYLVLSQTWFIKKVSSLSCFTEKVLVYFLIVQK